MGGAIVPFGRRAPTARGAGVAAGTAGLPVPKCERACMAERATPSTTRRRRDMWWSCSTCSQVPGCRLGCSGTRRRATGAASVRRRAWCGPVWAWLRSAAMHRSRRIRPPSPVAQRQMRPTQQCKRPLHCRRTAEGSKPAIHGASRNLLLTMQTWRARATSQIRASRAPTFEASEGVQRAEASAEATTPPVTCRACIASRSTIAMSPTQL
mmetsp:Transcript_9756/g.36697  ORF Transcript_9756/g.36697 Transcript_9756/m.36697 type:complete len:210 (-) Transcript_9756:1025-1654(-)